MSVKQIILIILIMTLIVTAPVFSKERVAVLDFEAKDVEASDALAISDLFRSDLVGTGIFIVLERGNMQSILNEHELTMKGLTNDASASEIGELLSVNYLFLGNLSKFGNKFIMVIDKINVETGEIEYSVKKNAVNMDAFLELSSEAAEELTGSEIVTASEQTTKGTYSADTLTELVSTIGFFNLLDIKTLDINTPTMQATDLGSRRQVYNDFALDNAIIPLLVNAATFGIGGNFMQGFDELGWASVGTTGLLAVSIISQKTVPIVISALLYTATYVTGIVSPYLYEARYNQYLKDNLLVY